jgi:hypothetical protein
LIRTGEASLSAMKPRVVTAGFIVSIAALAALLLPGAASANDTVLCGGKLTKATVATVEHPLEYAFHCRGSNPDASGTITSFSIAVNRRIDYFSPDTVGYDQSGEATDEAFSCQGAVPGWGFGCSGGDGMVAGHTMTGTFAPIKQACALSQGSKLMAWVSVTSTQTNHVKGTTYTDNSGPFRLQGPSCPKKHHR